MIDETIHGAGWPAKRGSRVWFLGFSLVGLVLATPLSARSAPADLGGFSVFVEAAPHVVVQQTKARSAGNFGVASEKKGILTNMTFRLGGGVKGPAIESIWGSPRPVIWGAALVPLNESSTIGTEFVESRAGVGGAERLEFSKYSIEYQTSGLAGVGLEFQVPVLDSEISIMPGIESLHLAVRYNGTAGLETQSGLVFQSISLTAEQNLIQHFVGPILRVGSPSYVLDEGLLEGVQIDFSVDVSVLFDVSGTRRVFGRSIETGERARFSFEAGPGVAQVGAGLQVRWP